MKRKKRWSDAIPWASIGYSLPTMGIAMLCVGYLVVGMLVLLPLWQRVNGGIVDLNDKREQLLAVRRTELERPGELNAEYSVAEAQLTALRALLMDRETASGLLDQLYVIAAGNGVQITDLQNQPAPEVEKEALYDITVFRVIARGDMQGLLSFLRQVQAVTVGASVQLTDFEAGPADDNAANLVFTLTLYTRLDQVDLVPLVPASPGEPSAQGELLTRPASWPMDWPWPPNDSVTQPELDPGALLVPERYLQHTVREGDTLLGIAMQYNISVEVVSQLNGLDVRPFVVGDVLQIPVYPAE